MTSGILFDFNGVIVDDEPQHCDALIATLAGYGVSLDRDTYYREYLGFDDRECFRFTFERTGHSTEDADLQEAVARAEEMPPRDALRFANAAGAICCQGFGAQPALPSRADVDRLVRGS